MSRTIVRTRRLDLDRLSPRARAELAARLHAIYCDTSDSMDLARFTEIILANGACRVALFDARDGALAGFSAARIIRVEAGGHTHAVFAASIFIRSGYRGGGAASAAFGLTEAMRFRLREPRVPLWYLPMIATPAGYALAARLTRRFYPQRGVVTPPEVEALVKAATAARGLSAVDGDPWRVPSAIRTRAPERFRAARSLRGDPDVAFFEARNPDYGASRPTSLVVAIPLEVADIAVCLARALREQWAHAWSRDTAPRRWPAGGDLAAGS